MFIFLDVRISLDKKCSYGTCRCVYYLT